MANPFPGMDPYLEGDLWMAVHYDLIAAIIQHVSPQLGPRYVALNGHRIVVAPSDAGGSSRYPDAGVYDASGANGTAGGAAVAAPPLVLTTDAPEAVTHLTAEIRDAKDRSLVAAIEVLSPTNKRGVGLREYAKKRRRVMASPAHLVEIDLLRTGKRFPVNEPLPDVPYFVFLSRAGRRRRVETWPVALGGPLPSVPVPLLPGDPEVTLDLQETFQRLYATVNYDKAIDHTRPPTVPLTPAQDGWADGVLRAAGKRA